MTDFDDLTLIGVDVGGTKVAAARVERGSLTAPYTVPTRTDDSALLVDQLVDSIEAVRTPECQAVGMAVPSVVDFAAGRVRFSVNVPLADLPLRDLLADRVGLPVFVDNDASVAALAEASRDGRVVVQNLIIFTVGTGVGGGIVIGGRLYRGATGGAAELGHVIIGADLRQGAPDPAATPPQPGSLESLAAGRVLDRLAIEAARMYPDSALGRLLALDGTVTGRDAVAAAMGGDERARRVVELLGERLGIGIANAINTFDPDEVVIGGGVSAAGDLLLRPARETALKYVLRGVGTQTHIRLARHGAEAGVLGAALMAGQELIAAGDVARGASR